MPSPANAIPSREVHRRPCLSRRCAVGVAPHLFGRPSGRWLRSLPALLGRLKYSAPLSRLLKRWALEREALYCSHALLPSGTEYDHDSIANAGNLSVWPHNLTCAWLPATTDWAVIPFLKGKAKRLRSDQTFHKSMPYFRALIRRRLDKRWREEDESTSKGREWLKVNFGLGPAQMGTKHADQFRALMPTPRRAAQFTYAMTGHAPIGAYQRRFRNQDNDDCPRCDTTQTRDHVLSACGRYFPLSLYHLQTQHDSVLLLTDFLRNNPLAFSFAHAPHEDPLAFANAQYEPP